MLLKWRKRFMLSLKLISARKKGRGKHAHFNFTLIFEFYFYFFILIQLVHFVSWICRAFLAFLEVLFVGIFFCLIF
jgi:hypothetical protein